MARQVHTHCMPLLVPASKLRVTTSQQTKMAASTTSCFWSRTNPRSHVQD